MGVALLAEEILRHAWSGSASKENKTKRSPLTSGAVERKDDESIEGVHILGSVSKGTEFGENTSFSTPKDFYGSWVNINKWLSANLLIKKIQDNKLGHAIHQTRASKIMEESARDILIKMSGKIDTVMIRLQSNSGMYTAKINNGNKKLNNCSRVDVEPYISVLSTMHECMSNSLTGGSFDNADFSHKCPLKFMQLTPFHYKSHQVF